MTDAAKREIPGAPGYLIDGACQIYRADTGEEIELSWPYAVVDTANGRVRIRAPRAAADAFIPGREDIRVFEETVGLEARTTAGCVRWPPNME